MADYEALTALIDVVGLKKEGKVRYLSCAGLGGRWIECWIQYYCSIVQVTIVDSTPGLLVNKKRVEGVRHQKKMRGEF